MTRFSDQTCVDGRVIYRTAPRAERSRRAAKHPARRGRRIDFASLVNSGAPSKSKEHLDYLARMVAEHVIELQLARIAKTVWTMICVESGSEIPVPAAATFPGGPVEYHWQVGPHQLSVEISADGQCHWFYRNKSTGATWGVEASVTDGLPPRFLTYFLRLVPGVS